MYLLSGWSITVWAKDFSVLRPGYLIVFETPNASFFFYGKNPISPNYVRLPETRMYLPVLPHVLAFFFFGADQSAMSSGLQYGKDIGLGEINTKHARLQREAPNPRRMRRNRKQERKVRMGLTLRKFPCPSTLSLLPPSHTTGRRRRPGQPN